MTSCLRHIRYHGPSGSKCEQPISPDESDGTLGCAARTQESGESIYFDFDYMYIFIKVYHNISIYFYIYQLLTVAFDT